jgi:hypothetical protein
LPFDCALLIGSSVGYATPSAAPPRPRQRCQRRGAYPESISVGSSTHSNAPFTIECQSFLSNIITRSSLSGVRIPLSPL